MLNPTNNQQMHREDDLTALDVCGGVLVLLILLVPTFLAASYLGYVSRLLASLVETLIHSATVQGAGLC